jgi:hypothetical protein
MKGPVKYFRQSGFYSNVIQIVLWCRWESRWAVGDRTCSAYRIYLDVLNVVHLLGQPSAALCDEIEPNLLFVPCILLSQKQR